MSYQGVNPYIQKPFGMNTASAAINMTNPNAAEPAMGAQIDTQTVVDAASDNFIGNRIKEYGEVDPVKQLGLSIPVMLAINAGMDKYMKLYDGPYEKSLAGKIGNFGDKVSEILFEKNPVGRFISDFTKNKAKPIAKKYIYDKSAILRAFKETPSKPELALAVQQMDMFKDFALKEYVNGVENFLKPLKSVKDFDSIGADKQTIERIEARIAAAPQDKAKIFFEEQYKLLKPTATAEELEAFAANPKKAEVIKNLKLNVLKLANEAEFEAIKAEPHKYIPKILDNLEKTDPKLFARIWTSDKDIFSKIGNFLYGRNVPFERIKNALRTVTVSPHKSAIGRGLNRAVTYITEGATGRMFNGKLSTIMQAYFVAEALLMAAKQDKMSDKARSFAERIVELIGFLAFMPVTMKLMHHIGGLKNTGLTPDQVKKLEDAIVEFNKKAQKLYAGDKAAYKAAFEAEIKPLQRPKTRNPFTWAARKIGDFVTTGLKTTIRPYSRFEQKEVDLCVTELFKNPVKYLQNIPHRLKDVACNPKYWFKRFAGWPIRFLLPLMVILPFFNKIAVKATHAIVGKPKYSLLDEEKYTEMQEKEAAQQTAQQQAQQQAQVSTPFDPNSLESTNLIRQAANGQHPQNQWTQTTTTAATATTENNKDNKELEPKRTYIPSPVGMVPQGLDMSALDKALAEADKAEAEIQGILARKY